MSDKRPEFKDRNSNTGLVGLGPIPSLSPVAAFNPGQIENLLKTKGIQAIHYKHAPIPNRSSTTGPSDPNTRESQWGFRFFEARSLLAVPQSFKLENQLTAQGLWGLHTVLLNITGQYTDGEEETVFMRPYDVVVLDKLPDGKGVTVETDQLAEYNPNGPIRLNFRVESVKYVADAQREYVCDQDFAIDNGKIRWLKNGRKPSFSNGKGATLSIVYYTKPIYIVQNVPHSIRVLPGNSSGYGALPRDATYGPQLVVGKQSWIRENNEELLDFSDLPLYPEYADTENVTGGTY